MTDIPEKEPLSFIAGDTVSWTKAIDDYLASDSWVLSYHLVMDGDQKTITASQNGSGDDFLAAISAADSANYTPGIYHYQARVTKGAEAYTVETGSIEVLANFEAQITGFDNRSHVKKTLDALESVILGKASKDQLSYSIAGRSISRLSPSELLEWRDAYQAEHNRNERRAGRKKPQAIQIQFS